MDTPELLPFLPDQLVKSTGILLLAFAVNSLWRSASAAQRCLVWSTAFVALLLLPLTQLVTPRWSFTMRSAEAQTPLPPIKLLAVMGQRSVVEHAEDPRPSPWHFAAPTAAQFLLGVWMAGACFVIARRGVGAWQVGRLHRLSRPVEDARMTELLAALAQACGIRRRMALRTSAEVSVPVTWGVFRPVLLLPDGAASWSATSLERALRHELGHIRHGDAVTRLLAVMVCAVFWPNVLVWLAAKAWRMAQEQACDDLVLRSGAASGDYAMQLLAAARSLRAGAFPSGAVMAMARPSTLGARLSAIMDDTRDRRPLRGSAWLAAGLAALAVLVMCGWMRLEAQTQPKTDPEAPAVVITTKVVEVDRTAAGAAAILDGVGSKPGAAVFMPEIKAEVLLRQLDQVKGADVLSAPQVTAVSGQQASIEITREFNGPDGKPMEGPKDQRVGLLLSLLPKVEVNGTITLDVDGVVREFNGYRADAATGGNQPVFLEWKTKEKLVFTHSGAIALVVPRRSPDPAPGAGAPQDETIFLISARRAPQQDKAPKEAPPAATSRSLQAAQKIILPHVDFRDTAVGEAVEFLRVKSKELDADKQGVNILLKLPPDHGSANARITLNLRDVPLAQALHYVAELAGLKQRAEEDALVLEPK